MAHESDGIRTMLDDDFSRSPGGHLRSAEVLEEILLG